MFPLLVFNATQKKREKDKKENSLKTTAKFYPRNIYRCLKYAAEINSVIQIQTSLSAKAIKLTPPVYFSSHLIESSAVNKDGRTVIRAQVAVRTCQAYTPTLETSRRGDGCGCHLYQGAFLRLDLCFAPNIKLIRLEKDGDTFGKSHFRSGECSQVDVNLEVVSGKIML